MDKFLYIIYFCYTILEGILAAYASFALSGQKIIKKRVILSGCFYCAANHIIRLMPVEIGVNTMLILLLLIFVTIFFNHIPYIKGIFSCTFFIIALFTSEELVLWALVKLTNKHVNDIINVLAYKIFVGVSSLLVVYILIKLTSILVIPRLYKGRE